MLVTLGPREECASSTSTVLRETGVGRNARTDRRAVEDGYVSITPLRLDLTDHEQLAKLKGAYPFENVLFGT